MKNKELDRVKGPIFAEIELGHNYNGSGPGAFGGADKWPVVKVLLVLCEGHEGDADEWADLLAKFFKQKGIKSHVQRYGH